MNLFNKKNAGLTALVGIAIVFPLFISDYWQYTLIIAFYYSILAASWNLLGGYTGQFSLGHHAFAMIGAYTSSLLIVKAGAPFWVSIPVAILLTMLLSSLLGVICLRVHGLYLALITWAFAEVVRNYIRVHYEFTGGDRGLDSEMIFGSRDTIFYYYLLLGLAIFTMILLAVIMRSRIGFYLRAIRDDTIAARSMGVDIIRYKILAFVIASGLAGMGGAFYGHSIGLISPIMGDFQEMAMIIICVVIGGLRTQSGPFVGAIMVRYLSEVLREYSEIRLVLLTLVVILTMRFFNGGLMQLWRVGMKYILRKGNSRTSAYDELD